MGHVFEATLFDSFSFCRIRPSPCLITIFLSYAYFIFSLFWCYSDSSSSYSSFSFRRFPTLVHILSHCPSADLSHFSFIPYSWLYNFLSSYSGFSFSSLTSCVPLIYFVVFHFSLLLPCFGILILRILLRFLHILLSHFTEKHIIMFS